MTIKLCHILSFFFVTAGCNFSESSKVDYGNIEKYQDEKIEISLQSKFDEDKEIVYIKYTKKGNICFKNYKNMHNINNYADFKNKKSKYNGIIELHGWNKLSKYLASKNMFLPNPKLKDFSQIKLNSGILKISVEGYNIDKNEFRKRNMKLGYAYLSIDFFSCDYLANSLLKSSDPDVFPIRYSVRYKSIID
jgi:hypothetical protein